MVLIEESINENEAGGCGSSGAGAQPRKPAKSPKLYLVINYAYVYEKIKNKFAPCIQENADEGTMTVMMKELGVEEQNGPGSNLASHQMERFPSSISFNGNNEPNEISEGIGEHSTIHPYFTRLDSNQWRNDYYMDCAYSSVGNQLHFN